MLTSVQDIGMISVIKVVSSCLTSADYAILKAAQVRAQQGGRSALLVDLQAVRRITQSGLAALLEFQSETPRTGAVGFFGARRPVREAIAKRGLPPLLPLFETQEDALESPEFRIKRLAGVKSVILVAGAGSRMAPLTQEMPKPMLDMLGHPIVAHLMQHMQRFGLRDFILNPGHLGPEFHAYFQSSANRSVQFVNEGHYQGKAWIKAPVGSAGTLHAIQRKTSAFDDNFFVLCGDALTDINLADMMEQHRARDADVTIAVQQVPVEDVNKYGIVDANAVGRIMGFVEKPEPENAPSNLASVGIYIFNPRVLKSAPLSAAHGGDIAKDLLPVLLQSGGRLDIYEGSFSWIDIGCVRDYYRANSLGLRGLLPDVQPDGAEIRRKVWCAPGADVDPRAIIVGPCHIGPGAVVEAGAKIEGPSVISAGARVCERALVRRSIVMPDSCVTPGTWVDDMIVCGDWAIDHRVADGTAQICSPLDGVVRVAATSEYPQTAGGQG
ncbi:NTP transferase domain-containing protein [Shimia sp. R10_1]|uniref:sugar phosphate nucleotidyltransferase n=1 Tax=Shimia sp. R10_1 TaxID=2821095 RepID=UPI001ADAC3B6|nr:sugar phosphate nucleotidyltransferase [Shimia sp. R10_1]MBO9475420.1 NTP transferase domain-containing protein [Shimia sp. R10_1]